METIKTLEITCADNICVDTGIEPYIYFVSIREIVDKMKLKKNVKISIKETGIQSNKLKKMITVCGNVENNIATYTYNSLRNVVFVDDTDGENEYITLKTLFISRNQYYSNKHGELEFLKDMIFLKYMHEKYDKTDAPSILIKQIPFADVLKESNFDCIEYYWNDILKKSQKSIHGVTKCVMGCDIKVLKWLYEHHIKLTLNDLRGNYGKSDVYSKISFESLKYLHSIKVKWEAQYAALYTNNWKNIDWIIKNSSLKVNEIFLRKITSETPLQNYSYLFKLSGITDQKIIISMCSNALRRNYKIFEYLISQINTMELKQRIFMKNPELYDIDATAMMPNKENSVNLDEEPEIDSDVDPDVVE